MLFAKNYQNSSSVLVKATACQSWRGLKKITLYVCRLFNFRAIIQRRLQLESPTLVHVMTLRYLVGIDFGYKRSKVKVTWVGSAYACLSTPKE